MNLLRMNAGVAAAAALILAAGPASAAGSGWVVVAAPPTGQNAFLVAAASTSDTDAWAVGSQGGAVNTNLGSKVLIDHWDGGAWNQSAVPAIADPTSGLDAVSASGPGDAWAVGEMRQQRYQFLPLALHWNGTSWSKVPSPNVGTDPLLHSVTTANAANDVWAVGDDVVPGTARRQTLTEQWNGSSWSVVASPDAAGLPTTLSGVATTPGASIVHAVGYSDSGTSTAPQYNPFALRNG